MLFFSQKFAIFARILLNFTQCRPYFFGIFPKCSKFPELSQSLPEGPRIGTSSGGRCIWPIHPPFSARSSARPAQPAALRDVPRSSPKLLLPFSWAALHRPIPKRSPLGRLRKKTMFVRSLFLTFGYFFAFNVTFAHLESN